MAKDNFATRIIISAKDEASGVFGVVRRNAGKLASAVLSYFSVSFFKSAIDEAEQLDVQMRKLEGVIEATGSAAGLTAQEIDEMARRLDEATTGSASGFRDAAAQLLTFKSVGKDAFETTLMLAQDLADAGFGSVTTNAVQLGKALEDPVKGMSALTRSGVTFSQQQTAVIRNLVETGRQAEAQGLILEAVAGQVGGVASAMGGGLTGAIDLANKRFTELKEQLGQAVLPVLTDLYNRLSEVFASLRDSGRIEELGKTLASAFKRIGEALITVVEFTAKWSRELVILAGAIAAIKLAAFVKGVAAATSGLWAAVTATKAMTAATVGLNAATSASGIAGLVGWFGKLRALVMVGGPIAVGLAALTLGVKKLADKWRESQKAKEAVITAMQDQAMAGADAALKHVQYLGTQIKAEEDLQKLTREGYESYKKRLEGAIEYHQALVLQYQMESVLGRDRTEQLETAQARVLELQQGHQLLNQIVGDGSKLASNGWEEQIRQAELYQEQLDAVSEAYVTLGITSQASLQEAAQQAEEAYNLIRTNVQSTNEDITAAFIAYAEKAVAANNGVISSSLQIQAEQRGVRLEVSETGRLIATEMGKAVDVTDEVADAFKRLGVQSQDELKKIAASAKEDFETIKKSGKASTADLQQAFQTYAQRAIEANNGIATHALKAEAAQYGLKIEADETGKVIVKAMDAAAKATEKVGSAADDAAKAYKRLAKAAKDADDKKDDKDDEDNKGSKSRSGGTFRAGRFSMSELQALDPKLAQQAAEAIADLNRNFASDGSSTYYRKSQYETAMRRIEQAAAAIESSQKQQKQESQQSREQSREQVSSLDEISKAMEQALAKAIPQAQQASKKVELTLNLPGNIKTTGMFDESEADRLMRELNSMARISR